ncbi:Glycerol-3-phosphate dehydrogenase, mitochondrial [Grifola frondosa]|uniref:Glycerol-3-phosphate dehydrogenase n=1 Tax=Grifola frondosa TaxID=5627 RepID=A0A1C7LYF6_GRIFR|nr:Glycerol-3-phosphate dehydrogenase, mitochondrial [Grifola frondosa]
MLRRAISRRTLAVVSGATLIAAGGGYYYLNSGPTYPPSTKQTRRPPPSWTPPSREQMLDELRASASNSAEFDVLVVGGGATGAGVAVDAASRGLRVALVERDDFSSGTSSKSTKLVHGGVRYLQKAVMELDYEQYKLVKEALHERRIFLQTAPYLSAMLPIMLPIYKYWQVPYYWVGCKMYDILAGKENMESSYLMSKGMALETFPMLKGDGLVGALVYYDGQHNDSRMNIALIMTAVQQGAIVANHVEVTSLHKRDGKLCGARVKDTLTGREWDVRAKGIVNATGPFTDALLTMDNPAHTPIVQPSAGTHITLPNYYSPRTMGLLDPATSDGRVIFFLPWQGNTIAGTTDTPAVVEREPRAQEEDIRWILEEVRHYLSPDIKVRRGDVLSAWAGLAPLVRNPNAASTEGLVRNHMIHVSDSGLLTIAGGKWTTYRAMAEETVDKAIEVFALQDRVRNGCVTDVLRLVGSDGWSRNMFIGLIQRYGLETEVAKHLSDNYGDRAWTVCALAQPTGEAWPIHGIRLSRSYPFIEAEVRYAVRHEYAQTAIDVIARRCRLSFLNAQAALDALPRVVAIMAEELKWSRARQEAEMQRATTFLASMGLPPGATSRVAQGGWRERIEGIFGMDTRRRRAAPEMVYSRAQFETGEVDALRVAFEDEARGNPARMGHDAVFALVRGLPGYEGVKAKDYEYVREEAGFTRAEDVDFDAFVEICAGLREVLFAPAARKSVQVERLRIPVEKSGGGV